MLIWIHESHTRTPTHLSMDVPAEAGRETLYVEGETTLVGQTLQQPLGAFLITILVLVFLPFTADQRNHVSLPWQTLGSNPSVCNRQQRHITETDTQCDRDWRADYGSTSTQRKDHADANLLWFCVGFQWADQSQPLLLRRLDGRLQFFGGALQALAVDARRVRKDVIGP